MTDTTDYLRSRIIAHRDQPDIYDPPTREDMYDRILSDAETIKAAKELAVVAVNTGCTTQEDANRLARAVAAFNAALEKSDG